MRLDPDLDRLLAHPCRTPALVVGEPAPAALRGRARAATAAQPTAPSGPERTRRRLSGRRGHAARRFRAMLAACGRAARSRRATSSRRSTARSATATTA